MSDRRGILAGGNWILDKIKFLDTYPQQDSLANILGETFSNGGGPFNVLVDLARLGAPFPLAGVGLIGDDAEGEWVHQECAKNGIDTTHLLKQSAHPTSYTDVMMVKSSGRRTFFHRRGANAALALEHFPFAQSSAKIFYLGYLLLLDELDQPDTEFGTVAARVLHLAREAGLKTCVDVVSEDGDRFAKIVRPALPYVDYCILNEVEIERTTGILTRPGGGIDLEAVKKASRELFQAGVSEWVIVHFPEGACATNAAGESFVQPSLLVPPEKIVGAVGAGDAFAAGVLLGLHDDLPVQTALRYGVATATACLQTAGTSDGIKPLEECLELTRSWSFRDLGAN